jgi:hypothetical protein
MDMQGRLCVCVSAERVVPREGEGGFQVVGARRTATWKGGAALHTPLGTKHAKREKGFADMGKKLRKGG